MTTSPVKGLSGPEYERIAGNLDNGRAGAGDALADLKAIADQVSMGVVAVPHRQLKSLVAAFEQTESENARLRGALSNIVLGSEMYDGITPKDRARSALSDTPPPDGTSATLMSLARSFCTKLLPDSGQNVDAVAELYGEIQRLSGENSRLRDALTDLIDAAHRACWVPPMQLPHRHDDLAKALQSARVVLSPPASQPATERCPHCDDTGDVHRADGEWLGECDCSAKMGARP